MKIKIKAVNRKIKSIKLCVPVDGIIDIDSNGECEVSEKCAKSLIEGTHDWKKVENIEDSKKDKEDSKTSDDSDKKEDSEESEESDDPKEEFKKMKKDELISFIKENKYPESEWSKFLASEKNSEKLLAAYLIKKYNEALKKI
jgi:hypothetical protein